MPRSVSPRLLVNPWVCCVVLAEMVKSPENPSNNSLSTPRVRRARVACKACNARRVKCDAADGQPCWHCQKRNTHCELIESRRGKYVVLKLHAVLVYRS